jgi:hypothetical protein
MPTLQVTLEEVARLRPTYILNEAGYEWPAGELLQWLHQHFPVLLDQPVYLLRPRIGDTGAIYAVDQAGEIQSAVPLYRIELRPPPVLAPWMTGKFIRTESSGATLPLGTIPSW